MCFIRIESNSLQLKKEEFNLYDLIMYIIQDYKNQIATERRIKLVYNDYEEREHSRYSNSIPIYADKNRISQVISNLISNSIKFTKDAGDNHKNKKR